MNDVVMIAAVAGLVAELVSIEMARRARRRRDRDRRISIKALDQLNGRRS